MHAAALGTSSGVPISPNRDEYNMVPDMRVMQAGMVLSGLFYGPFALLDPAGMHQRTPRLLSVYLRIVEATETPPEPDGCKENSGAVSSNTPPPILRAVGGVNPRAIKPIWANETLENTRYVALLASLDYQCTKSKGQGWKVFGRWLPSIFRGGWERNLTQWFSPR
ncbi:hypothetical protein BX600DRAFT_429304 [Xylariales sp. PMI_506]|nr:hypothetical protein BX600DRAFT_429304 [Xylariales sp. PMI_506]